jgi:hypothetical protein
MGRQPFERYLNDRRSDDEKKTHTCLVGGKDSFMSGWGHEYDNEPPESWAFWACTPDLEDTVEEWVQSRDEFSKVKVRTEKWIDEKSKDARISIHVVTPSHRYAKPMGESND